MTSATAHLARVVLPGEGRQLNELGHTAIEKIGSAETGGAYYSFEVLSPPGLGIPPHVHSREDEVIYVVEGEYEIFLGGRLFRAGPGSVLNFARGTAHGFQNVGATEGRTLWVVTPGASFEQFFHELAQVPPGPPDVPALAALFGRYGWSCCHRRGASRWPGAGATARAGGAGGDGAERSEDGGTSMAEDNSVVTNLRAQLKFAYDWLEGTLAGVDDGLANEVPR